MVCKVYPDHKEEMATKDLSAPQELLEYLENPDPKGLRGETGPRGYRVFLDLLDPEDLLVTVEEWVHSVLRVPPVLPALLVNLWDTTLLHWLLYWVKVRPRGQIH